MPTGVYLSNDSSDELSLSLVPVGPTDQYMKNFQLRASTVPVGPPSGPVLSIDRDFHWEQGDAVQVCELRAAMRGRFVCALQVMLRNVSAPLAYKNLMCWALRVPTPDVMRFVEDRREHEMSYIAGGMQVYAFVWGMARDGFDDLTFAVSAKLLPAPALDPVTLDPFTEVVESRFYESPGSEPGRVKRS